MWRRNISWWWPAAVLLLGLVAVGVLWLLGRNPPLPEFRLDASGKGAQQIKPVDWPWWRQAANWLHGRKYLMLTFDDGPSDHQTNMRILHILEKHHAHAAFFLCVAMPISLGVAPIFVWRYRLGTWSVITAIPT